MTPANVIFLSFSISLSFCDSRFKKEEGNKKSKDLNPEDYRDTLYPEDFLYCMKINFAPA